MASSHKNADNDDRGNAGTYKFGDLVWARVGSHYWPGHIYHPSLASKSARDRCIPGDSRLLVSFFGDDSYCWCCPSRLLPFEPHFQRMSQQATTVPALLQKTVREALDEVWRRASLGLTCRGLTEECGNCGSEICERDDATGFFDVRVMDDEWSKIYSKDQIEEARKSFPLEKALRLIRRSAESPSTVRIDSNYLDLIQMVGTAMAYRRRSFVYANERYRKEFKELTGNSNVTIKSLIDHEFGGGLRKNFVADESRSSLVTQQKRTPSEIESKPRSSKRKAKAFNNQKIDLDEPEKEKHLRKQREQIESSKFVDYEQSKNESSKLQRAHDNNGKLVSTFKTSARSDNKSTSPLDEDGHKKCRLLGEIYAALDKAKDKANSTLKPVKMSTGSLNTDNTADKLKLKIKASELVPTTIKTASEVTESDRVHENTAREASKTNLLMSAQKNGATSDHKRRQPDVMDAKQNNGEKRAVAAADSSKKRKKKDNDNITIPAASQPETRAENPETEPSVRTVLILKFPQNSRLPSVAELKARFACFGPIIASGIRVYWKSFTCMVPFESKSDAEAAQESKLNHIFGHAAAYMSYTETYREPEVTKHVPEVENDQVQAQKGLLKSCLKKASSAAPEAMTEEEFSARMLGLMQRCSDIVNKVKEAFGSGYIPYHLFLQTGQGPSSSNYK